MQLQILVKNVSDYQYVPWLWNPHRDSIEQKRNNAGNNSIKDSNLLTLYGITGTLLIQEQDYCFNKYKQ